MYVRNMHIHICVYIYIYISLSLYIYIYIDIYIVLQNLHSRDGHDEGVHDIPAHVVVDEEVPDNSITHNKHY